MFPAHAGMIPFAAKQYGIKECVPRACGDDPDEAFVKSQLKGCSPRMRG